MGLLEKFTLLNNRSVYVDLSNITMITEAPIGIGSRIHFMGDRSNNIDVKETVDEVAAKINEDRLYSLITTTPAQITTPPTQTNNDPSWLTWEANTDD